MKKTLVGVVVVALLPMTVPHAYGEESLLQTIDVVSMDPNPPRIPLTEGQHYSGSRFAENAKPKEHELVQVGKNAKLPNPTNYYAVTHIAIEEKRNNPCRISLWGRMVDPRFRTQERKLAQFALDTCNIDKDLDRVLSENGFKDNELTGFYGHDNRFIRGLDVCMGGRKDPIGDLVNIKGLRVKPAAIAQFESDAVEPRDDVKESEKPHCEAWSKWNMCPDGQIVTGVKVYFGDKEFRALGVSCKAVKLQQRFEAPVKDAIGY